MPNGHASGMDEGYLRPSSRLERSESELSDVNDLPTNSISPNTEVDDMEHSDDDAIHAMATSELDEDEDAPGEEDADFSEETPPPQDVDAMRHDRSSSGGSSRLGKRKADDVDDEEYMKQNPELYGLRRSVRML